MGKLDEIKEKLTAKVHEVKANHETGVDAVDDRLDQHKSEAKAQVEDKL